MINKIILLILLSCSVSNAQVIIRRATLRGVRIGYTNVVASGSPCDSVFTSNVKFYGRLDEASGSRADTSGNGNNLTDSGSTASAAAIINNGASFSATTVLSHANNTSLQAGGQSYSEWFWVKFNSVSALQAIVSKGQERLVWLNGSGQLEFFINGGGTVLDSSLSMSTGVWYFVVITHAAGGAMDLYVTPQGGSTTHNTSSGAVLSSTTDSWCIGAFDTVPNFKLNGIVDEVGFTKAILSGTDMTNLYGGGSGCRPTGL